MFRFSRFVAVLCLLVVGLTLATPAVSRSSDHDPYDNSHKNAAPGMENVDEFRTSLAGWSFVLFLMLLALVTKFAWRPIMDGLEKREQSIANMIDEAKRSSEKAAEQLRLYEARLAKAEDDAREKVSTALRDAEKRASEVIAKAQADATRERDRALADIEAAKNAAVQDLAQRSVNLAVSLAGRLLHKEVRPQDHAQLIREALDRFPSKN